MRSRISTFLVIAISSASCLFADVAVEDLKKWKPTQAQWDSLNSGEVVVVKKTSSSASASTSQAAMAAILIDGQVEPIWDLIEDKEGIPKFIHSITSAKIIGQEEGHDLVEQKMKIGPSNITYVIKHMTEGPNSIRFCLHSGDLKELNGHWEFVSLGEGEQTMLIYHLSLKPGFPLPGFVIRNSLAKNLPEALVAIREEVDRRS